MEINAEGLKLVEDFENFIPFVYDDFLEPRSASDFEREWKGGPVRGTLTIGYGTTRKELVTLGRRCTEAEAAQWLHEDLHQAENDVSRLVKVPLSSNPFSALVSFTYNCGAGTLQNSTMLRLLNQGNYDAVPREMMKFVNSKGVKLNGLVRRRAAEAALWAKPYDPVVSSGVTPDPVPDRTLTQTKTVKGGIIATVATVTQQASSNIPDAVSMVTDNKDTILSFSEFVPWLKAICVIAIIVGVILVIYGRYDVKQQTGT